MGVERSPYPDRRALPPLEWAGEWWRRPRRCSSRRDDAVSFTCAAHQSPRHRGDLRTWRRSSLQTGQAVAFLPAGRMLGRSVSARRGVMDRSRGAGMGQRDGKSSHGDTKPIDQWLCTRPSSVFVRADHPPLAGSCRRVLGSLNRGAWAAVRQKRDSRWASRVLARSRWSCWSSWRRANLSFWVRMNLRVATMEMRGQRPGLPDRRMRWPAISSRSSPIALASTRWSRIYWITGRGQRHAMRGVQAASCSRCSRLALVRLIGGG